jgi:hypothetical protein
MAVGGMLEPYFNVPLRALEKRDSLRDVLSSDGGELS